MTECLNEVCLIPATAYSLDDSRSLINHISADDWFIYLSYVYEIFLHKCTASLMYGQCGRHSFHMNWLSEKQGEQRGEEKEEKISSKLILPSFFSVKSTHLSHSLPPFSLSHCLCLSPFLCRCGAVSVIYGCHH